MHRSSESSEIYTKILTVHGTVGYIQYSLVSELKLSLDGIRESVFSSCLCFAIFGFSTIISHSFSF